MKPDKHEHSYTDIKLIPVTADREYRPFSECNYAEVGTVLPTLGEVQQMGILARFCDCGDYRAFEYGPRAEMVALGKRVKNELQD